MKNHVNYLINLNFCTVLLLKINFKKENYAFFLNSINFVKNEKYTR